MNIHGVSDRYVGGTFDGTFDGVFDEMLDRTFDGVSDRIVDGTFDGVFDGMGSSISDLSRHRQRHVHRAGMGVPVSKMISSERRLF